jgi:hypothetical protein
MAAPDSGIKKVIILKSSLPQRSGINENYVVRFRIVSEDKNRSSHWSTKYRIPLKNVSTIPFSLAVSQTNKTITAVWTPTPDTKSEFDVYVKWDSENWKYVTTVYSTMFATIIKDGATNVKVAVQIPTFPKQRFANATLFESLETSINGIII